MENNTELWVDKYRPTNLNDYVLNDEIKTYFKNMVQNKSIQNFTVEGCPGSGKTTLARLLVNELGAEVLFIKCATEGQIDTLRSKIEPFCNALSFEGKQKIVILDEVDASSGTTGNGSGFQSGLRTLIESAQDNCRFILTCNYVNKVIPAVLSRCPIIPLKYDKKDLLIHLKKILDTEKISYTKDSLKTFVEESFQYYPDCRRIINYLQLCCNSGALIVNLKNVVDSDKTELLKEIVLQTISTQDILQVRKFYLTNKSKISDYMEFASEIYNYSIDNNYLNSKEGILKLTDILYQLNLVIDKESHFFGFLTALNHYGKK